MNDRSCAVPGCNLRYLCRGYCEPHLRRLDKYGDPLAGPAYKPAQRFASVEDRFWSRVAKDGANGCWVWTGGKIAAGYGTISIDGKDQRTHRVSWLLLRGPVPPGLELDHLCRNRACCNPDHLEPVTHKENARRGTSPAADAARKTHCLRGHLFDDANTRIDRHGARNCRKCKALKQREYNAKARRVLAARRVA